MESIASATLAARRWREPRSTYQEHASWHEATRLDGPRFEVMVKFFARLRRPGRRADSLAKAA